MFCRHLTLTNFRNYVQLDLSLAPHLSVFWGNNGQGKSNLIEALYLLATTRSYRTAAEREMVNWHAAVPPVFARVAADVQRHPTPQRLEVILAETPGSAAGEGRPPPGVGQPPASSVRRRVRINGQHRQPAELLGHLNVVLFSPEDVELIAGPAAVRRRYLDITLCQVDHVYLRTRNRYERVLQQRNALLREARERAVRADQFEYWDVQLVELGSSLVAARVRALHLLNESIAAISPRLAGDASGLRAEYRSSVALDDDAPALAAERVAGAEPAEEGGTALARLRERFAAQLAAGRARERQQAVTLAGPHRDDAVFYAGAIDLRTFGSRGQQRSAALSLKLAEAELMQRYTGERPLLLLDDVMSELDPRRRGFLQEMVLEQREHQGQVLVTATELAPFGAGFLDRADVYQVEAGAVTKGATGSDPGARLTG
ncbi:MAG TPA: DNA replication/repair protein RecF [Chloroflexota bacterium]|jgi:DNA replication and repair protein RecF|nr:DNA replication/repair protein RecF [Chloroflexota bacterium]